MKRFGWASAGLAVTLWLGGGCHDDPTDDEMATTTGARPDAGVATSACRSPGDGGAVVGDGGACEATDDDESENENHDPTQPAAAQGTDTGHSRGTGNEPHASDGTDTRQDRGTGNGPHAGDGTDPGRGDGDDNDDE